VVGIDGQVEGLSGMVQVKKKKEEDQRLFEVNAEEIFSNHSKQAKSKAGEKMDNYQGARPVFIRESVVAVEQHQVRSERRVCFVLDSPRLPHGRREKCSFEKSGQSIRREIRMSSAIERERTRLLDGHRDRHVQRLSVSGPNNSK